MFNLDSSDPDRRNIIHSTEAEKFLSMVTKGFYDRSFTGLWLFEVIGREWDEMAAWADGLKEEIHPQTCTWSIAVWEWVYGITSDNALSLEYRRQRVLAKILGKRPINPETLRRGIARIAGEAPEQVIIKALAIPYSFSITIRSTEKEPPYDEIAEYIRQTKPAHLSTNATVIVTRTFRQQLNICFAGAVGSSFATQPISEDRENTLSINVRRGGFIADFEAAKPISQNRTSKSNVNVAQGGFLLPSGINVPLTAKKSADANMNSAGSLYCTTHVKSKLIE